MRLLIVLIITVLISWCQPVQSFDNPDLLPEYKTPVLDLARILTEQQEEQLSSSIKEFESESGWKLRVLTQFEQTPGLAVRNYWNLDERSVLLVADPRGGNLLNFNVGDGLFALMPRLFWVELQTRYGNQYYVRDNGEDKAIISSLESIKTCLDKGGCKVVPGLPKEQMLWSIVTSIIGGIVAGIAAFPKDSAKTIEWKWLLLFSPLWIMLFVIFGLTPIITRTSDILPIFRSSIGFLGSAIAAYFAAKLTIAESQTD